MLHALPDGVDGGVDRSASCRRRACRARNRAGRLRELDVGAYADRHHDEVGRDLRAVGETHTDDALPAEDRRSLRLHREMQPAPLELGAQERGGRRIELPLHQVRQR